MDRTKIEAAQTRSRATRRQSSRIRSKQRTGSQSMEAASMEADGSSSSLTMAGRGRRKKSTPPTPPGLAKQASLVKEEAAEQPVEANSVSSRQSPVKAKRQRSVSIKLERSDAKNTKQKPAINPGNVTPFYVRVISPACDKIVQYVPHWITPDCISTLGLVCAIASLFCVTMSGPMQEYFHYAAIFWFLYGLLDNLDGKQARRLQMCTAGGDFLDHSSDSLSCSFAALILIQTLLGNASLNLGLDSFDCLTTAVPHCMRTLSGINLKFPIKLWAFVCFAQGPFYVATWAHPIIGRIMLSATIDGTTDYVSVDEYNLLILPFFLCFSKMFPWFTSLCVSDIWQSIVPSAYQDPAMYSESVIYYQQKASSLLVEGFQSTQIVPQAQIPIGLVLLLGAAIFSFKNLVAVMLILLRPPHILRFLPGVAFFTVTWYFEPPVCLEIFFFSFLCLELIAARLRLHMRSLLYLWVPVTSYGLTLILMQWITAPDGTLLRSSSASLFLCNLWSPEYKDLKIHHIISGIICIVWISCLLSYKCIINYRNPRK